MRDPGNFTAFLLELLAPLGPVSARRMFGGVGLFHGGMMFGLIARDELFLKVSDANRPSYEAAGEAPFSYDTKHGVHTLQSGTGVVRPNFWTIPKLFGTGRARRSGWLRPRPATKRRPAGAVSLPRRARAAVAQPQAARVSRFTNAESRCRRNSLRALSSVVM